MIMKMLASGSLMLLEEKITLKSYYNRLKTFK